jgi:uncharacterized membrane protein
MGHLKNKPMSKEIFISHGSRKNQFLGKRGAVALLVGLSASAVLMALGLGIGASGRTAMPLRLQRTADMAAIAGAPACNSGTTTTGAALGVDT